MSEPRLEAFLSGVAIDALKMGDVFHASMYHLRGENGERLVGLRKYVFSTGKSDWVDGFSYEEVTDPQVLRQVEVHHAGRRVWRGDRELTPEERAAYDRARSTSG